MRVGIVRKPLVEVTCLGTGKRHKFLSADPTSNRICTRCKFKMSKIQLPCIRVCKVTDNDLINRYDRS